MRNIYNFFQILAKTYTIDEIAYYVSVNKGTIKRWIENRMVPPYYYFDLCRMAGIEIDYSKYSEKDKDQFYTTKKTSQYCIDRVYKILKTYNVEISDYYFIEPSAGDGSFYSLLPPDKRIGVDIEPRYDGIEKADFLLWKPNTIKNICIGNPPFGLRGHLALKFINHASVFSDFVCFILPQLFDSNGKGSCKNRVKMLNLIHSEVINSEFYYPNGRLVNVNVVFQIWSKLFKSSEKGPDLSKIIKLYSLSDGGTPGTTRNKNMIDACNYYLPSTCFGVDKMKLYDNFEELPQKRGYGIVVLSNNDYIKSIIEGMNWGDISFKSTNGAYNLRFDLIERGIERGIERNM